MSSRTPMPPTTSSQPDPQWPAGALPPAEEVVFVRAADAAALGAAAQSLQNPEDSIEILDVVARLARHWIPGALTAALVGLAGFLYVEHLPAKFESSAAIMPRSAPTVSSNSLAALFSGGRASSPFMPLLVSRTLRDDVVRRTDLLHTLHTTSLEAARGALNGMTKLIVSPDGEIFVIIRSTDANQTIVVANAYLDALRSMQEHIAESQDDLQQHFAEQQLEHERAALAAAEQDLERAQEASGVIQSDTQTQIGLGAIASTRAEITSLQVRLAALLQSETEQNPEVRTLRSQINALEGREHALQTGTVSGGVGAAPAAGRMPGLNLDLARKQREVRYHESLVNSLATHFDSLRLSSAATGDTFDVIDRPVLPESPTWPPRSLYLSVVAAGALFAGLVAILVAMLVDRIRSSPTQRAYLRQIRQNAIRRRRAEAGPSTPPTGASVR